MVYNRDGRVGGVSVNIVIPKPVNEILLVLYENNYDGYLVGGTVRNLVLEQKPNKYTIATNANLDDLLKKLKIYNPYIIGDEKKKIIISNTKFPMEIIKYGTKDNNIESYLLTKDFTMNALAFSDEDGLLDYSSGLVDIKSSIIRLNGNEDENYIKDPLKILRTIRLAGEYKMKIDAQTLEYMFDNKELLKDVPAERIRDEFSKIMLLDRISFYLKKYLDIFLVFLPELTLMENFEQNNPYHVYDVWEHTLISLKTCEKNLELRLAVLFHDIAKPLTYEQDENGVGRFPNHAKKGAMMARDILNRLKFSKKQIQVVTKLIEYHNHDFPMKEVDLKRFLSNFNSSELEKLFKLKYADTMGKNPDYMSDTDRINKDFERVRSLIRRDEVIKKSSLKINGKDLINLGILQEQVGNTLEQVYRAVLDGKIKNDKDLLINYVIKNFLPADLDK